MATLKQRVLELVRKRPGLTDRQITDRLKGRDKPQQAVNQACRQLADAGLLFRRLRDDGLIGNYRSEKPVKPSFRSPQRRRKSDDDSLSEDSLKRALQAWLCSQGWEARIAWRNARGVDVEAKRGGEHWLIEVKGRGSRPAMRVNYFLAVIGELLQRMDCTSAKYSIALADLDQFTRLWDRLPRLAKQRTQVTALFVSERGHVRLVP